MQMGVGLGETQLQDVHTWGQNEKWLKDEEQTFRGLPF